VDDCFTRNGDTRPTGIFAVAARAMKITSDLQDDRGYAAAPPPHQHTILHNPD
jgi:hypothetical protein